LRKSFTVIIVEPIHADGVKLLKKFGKVIQLPPNSTSKDLLRVSRNADAFVTRGFVKIPAEVLEVAKKLKVIGVHGVGIDHIDVDFAQKRGIQVVQTPKALTEAVAEFTVGLMLSLLRKIPAADTAVRSAEWSRKYGDLVGVDLTGKTVGLIGLGRIGSAVAKRIKAFGVRLIYYQRVRNPKLEKGLGVEYTSFHQLLKTSDVISLHVPLTPETHHMISHNEFKFMKHGVYIVNTSRGAVMDEKAMYEALASGKAAGAALDVFESEPLSANSPLIRLKNVVLAPHLAASSTETLRRMAVAVAEEVIRVLAPHYAPEKRVEKVV